MYSIYMQIFHDVVSICIIPAMRVIQQCRMLYRFQFVVAPLPEARPGGERFYERMNLFRTAVTFWGQLTQNLTALSPKRDCGSKRVNTVIRWFGWKKHEKIRRNTASKHYLEERNALAKTARQENNSGSN